MEKLGINNFRYRAKMAGFDYDHTLVKPKSGGTFSKGVWDWEWLSPNVPEKLKKLYHDGFAIVIFTNQRQKFKRNQIILALSELKIPIRIYIATEKKLKKPCPVMYMDYRDGKKVNGLEGESFYVGDALGRKDDWSDVDKLFAEKIGVKYYSPEEFFR